MTIDNAIDKQTVSSSNPKQTLLPFNVPEKIIIVYDSAIDEENTEFVSNGESVAPNEMLKLSVRNFIANKNLIDSRHEFALVVINASGFVWLNDFSNNVDGLNNLLTDVPSCEPEDIISIGDLFRLLKEKIILPDVQLEQATPSVPPFVVRVLFTYGRSFTLPQVALSEALKFLTSPFFTFDVLMTHESPSPTNNCKEICERLQQIDKKGFAYFLPVERNSSELHFSMAKLLGHPLQRPPQHLTDYKIHLNK